MAVIDISNVSSKLVGVCCLQGQERDLVKNVWSCRFSEHTAFFVDASEEDSALKLTRKIYHEVEQRGFEGLPGLSVILVTFLDLTKELSPELLKAIAGLPSRLSNALGCEVQMRLQFGFVGARSEIDYEPACAKVKQAIASDPYGNGLILVAEQEYGGKKENRWKAVALFLDMLRRGASVSRIQSADHEEGTVGYLRYGEYDANQLAKLKEEQQMLTQSLSDRGNIEFNNKVNVTLSDLEMRANNRFQINAAMQPIHPDMIVTGPINVWKARHGNNQDFNRARAATVDAVGKTGSELEKDVLEFFRAEMGDPRDALIRLFTEAGVGIGFVEKRAQVSACLEQKLQSVANPQLPILAFHENGYTDEITMYLTGKLSYAVYNAKKWYLERLSQAYRDMKDQNFATERMKMQHRLDVVKNNMDHVPTKQHFCNISVGGGAGLNSQFTTFMGAEGDMTLKHLVCRREEDRQWIEQNCTVVGGECRYFIHEMFGGMAKLDDVPIKTVHAALFACTDERLEELLSEE